MPMGDKPVRFGKDAAICPLRLPVTVSSGPKAGRDEMRMSPGTIAEKAVR